MTTYLEMTDTARNKFGACNRAECEYAIKDIHRTLFVACAGKELDDTYVQKLWCELDAVRDRIREIEKQEHAEIMRQAFKPAMA
jgi:hypothetical protein